ncbi:MAG: hypothetical protein JSU63_03710 [Phycisphaerales bacterium]|nr:MAG: hypothetical protein JSU63_03710 [Phycisphaerales bacterium]
MIQRFRAAGCAAVTIMFLAGLTGCPTPAPPPDDGDGDDTPPVVCVPLSVTSFTTDSTLSAGCYTAESSISVSGDATLTVEPGVTIKFQQGVEMTVWGDGKLSAVGTADLPVVLTGEEAIRGYWDGLRFYQSNSTVNQLDYVTIEYAGAQWDANLYLAGSSNSPARVDITNCTLRESEAYGFVFTDAEIGEFSGNTITANAVGAGSVTANDAGYLDDTSTYAGNDVDIVRISGSTLSEDRTWPGIDADYLIDGDIGVQALLTIAPGATLVFAQENEMTVWGDGRLSAVGTAVAPILFTGNEEIRGYWSGLRFYHSNSTNNQLDYVTFEYGGGYFDANLYLDGASDSPARVNITNCTFRESETYGLSMEDAVVEQFSGNTLTANTLGAVNTTAENAGYLDDTSTYVGNDEDIVRIASGTISTAVTWSGIDGAYFIDGSIGVDALLTLEPGARLVFNQNEEMTVWSEGRLSAVGTADVPITFTGAETTSGYWRGLRFYHSNSDQNRLDYVTIEYGGGYWDGNLYLASTASEPATVEVTNSSFTNSATYGIYIDADSTINDDVETANTFANNASGDVFWDD